MRLLSVVWCVWMLGACSVTRKSALTAETVSIASDKAELHTFDVRRIIDTTVTERGKITITEIEFYQPSEISFANNVSDISLQNIGSIGPAAIKSIRQATIETETEKKGETEESSSETGATNETATIQTENVTKLEVTPTPDPKRWRYIFYIMLLAVIILLYLRRVPVVEWVKRMVKLNK